MLIIKMPWLKGMFFFFLVTTSTLYAQQGVQGLVTAEKNFAAYSVAHGTRDAFLQFLDSTGIVFENGQAVNGLASWNAKQKGNGVLDWEPSLACISTSGDLGFTTGPWTYKTSSADTVRARGIYVTIWHLDAQQHWKFLVDLGVGKTVPQENGFAIVGNPFFEPGNLNGLAEAEENYIRQYDHSIVTAYQQFLSSRAITRRNGLSTVNDPADHIPIAGIHFTMTGNGISSAGDLGYVYGNAVRDGNAENYLRIWQREGRQWKIILEVLRF
jgi:hypothetical protein